MCPFKMTTDSPRVATVDVYILEGNLVMWLEKKNHPLLADDGSISL